MANTSPAALLLNVAHAVDHLVLLVFATAVGAIAADFGMAWQDLMPYTIGAFVLFGIGSMPAGWLGDLWGRRAMMIVFFFGMGVSTILVALCRSPWQMAVALTVMGAFSAIYHPVGIAMLVQNVRNLGITIGINGLVGNLGVAAAAALTGFLVQHAGWRAAYLVPGAVCLVCGVLFWLVVPQEEQAPAKRAKKTVDLPRDAMVRIFAITVATATAISLSFNFTTNGNAELFRERLAGITAEPQTLGLLLGLVYTVASVAQIVVGKLIDRYPLKYVFLTLALAQVPVFFLASLAQDWWLLALATLFMVLVFGQIPFSDAMVATYFDDRMRSRVMATRLAISFGASSMAVALIGPLHKTGGWSAMLLLLAAFGVLTTLLVALLPGHARTEAAAARAPAE